MHSSKLSRELSAQKIHTSRLQLWLPWHPKQISLWQISVAQQASQSEATMEMTSKSLASDVMSTCSIKANKASLRLLMSCRFSSCVLIQTMWQDKSSVARCRRYLLILSETTWINKSHSDSIQYSHVSPMQKKTKEGWFTNNCSKMLFLS